MNRLLLAISLLCLTCCSECYAGYTIVIRERITPQFVTVMGVGKTETVLNPGPTPSYPPTAVRLVYRPDNTDLYSSYPARRAELWEDTAGSATSAEIFATFPGIRTWKEGQIRTEGARRLATLTPYLPEERDTWPQQQSEAIEWRGNAACDCAMIRTIAEVRGITVEALVQKIEENIAQFPAAAGAILGEQQKLLDRIEAATDFATMMSITWE